MYTKHKQRQPLPIIYTIGLYYTQRIRCRNRNKECYYIATLTECSSNIDQVALVTWAPSPLSLLYYSYYLFFCLCQSIFFPHRHILRAHLLPNFPCSLLFH
jgi:hypothetical protein